jgi:thiamine pyrophosphokinase
VENILKTLKYILPDALVCLNGILPSSDTFFFLRSQNLPILAADGAANSLRQQKIIPQYIIGDLDSLSADTDHWQQQKVQIVRVDDQNSTDFEKCLEFALSQGWKNILVCGMHGGELDHTLNNWSIVMRYGKRMNLAIYDAGKMGIPLYEFHQSVHFSIQAGTMISLIPQPFARLTTCGLQWELTNEVLALGEREGARNRAVQEAATIIIHSGSLFVMVDAILAKMLAVK